MNLQFVSLKILIKKKTKKFLVTKKNFSRNFSVTIKCVDVFMMDTNLQKFWQLKTKKKLLIFFFSFYHYRRTLFGDMKLWEQKFDEICENKTLLLIKLTKYGNAGCHLRWRGPKRRRRRHRQFVQLSGCQELPCVTRCQLYILLWLLVT